MRTSLSRLRRLRRLSRPGPPRRAVALAVVVLGVLAADPAAAFLCTRTPSGGPSVFWDRREIVLRPSGGGAEVDSFALEAVLRRSAQQWTNVDCSDFNLRIGDPTIQRLAGFDWHAGTGDASNQNIVIFRQDTPGDEVDRWVHTLGALAITTVTFESSTGRLLDADVEINDTSFTFTTCNPDDVDCIVEFDLQNTLTHELGHVVGLDHPPNDEPDAFEATMFASASRGDTEKRDLAVDDANGLCAIYPAADPEPGECFGVGRVSPPPVVFEQTLCAGVGTPRTQLASLVALAFGLLVGRRRRRG